MRFLFIILLLFCVSSTTAQKQNNTWILEDSVVLDFNTSPASSYKTTIPYVTNGNYATAINASDKNTGQLLFYFRRHEFFNKNNVKMPNGKDIYPWGYWYESPYAALAPFINDDKKYYFFNYGRAHNHGAANNPMRYLYYSVIDMNLDGGLGDVEAGNKVVMIDSQYTPAMVVTKGCKGLWLITGNLQYPNYLFYAYHITDNGLSTIPAISTAPLRPDYFKVSPDGSTLAVLCRDILYGRSSVRLFDFDAITGLIDNERVIDIDSGTGARYSSCEFSPNSKVLYVNNRRRRIFQYDLSLGSGAAINTSRKTVYTEPNTSRFVSSLQMAPDSNIYVVVRGSDSGLHRISNPNALYPNCVYTPNATIATPNRRGWNLLPLAIPDVPCLRQPVYVGYRSNVSACLKQPLTLESPRVGSNFYKWQDGSTQTTFSAKTEGTYWVASGDSCCYYVDTFVVTTKRDTISTSRDAPMCITSDLVLRTQIQTPGATHIWDNGSTTDSIIIKTPGKYWVMSTEICDVTIDTVTAKIVEAYAVIPSPDTTLCPGDTLLITGEVYPKLATAEWNNGYKQLSTRVSAPGRYILEADYLGCTGSATINIANHPRVLIELGENQEICTDQPLILPRLVTSDETDVYLWQDGSNTRKYTVRDAGTYYVSVTNLCGATASDSVTITTRNCRLFFPNAFTPNGDGLNDIPLLRGDVANVTDYEIHVFHRWGEEVFSTNDINKGWDGMHNGIPAAMGTYAYYMKYKYHGKDEIRSGSLILIR